MSKLSFRTCTICGERIREAEIENHLDEHINEVLDRLKKKEAGKK